MRPLPARGVVRGCAIVLFAAALTAGAAPSSSSRDRIVLGWNTGGRTSTYIEQASRSPGANVLSPTWWHLTDSGGVTGTGDRAYSDWAHDRDMLMWPLFGNGTDPDRTHRVLRDPAARRSLIGRIGDLATGAAADGVNIDWENMHTEDRDLFSAFVREAAEAWRPRGLTVSVDVTAKTDDWSLGNWSEAYDRRALGQAADLVVLMAYDQHNRLRPNGPVAALPWVRDCIEFLMRDVPAAKIVLGVPLYTYDWSQGKPTTVSFDATPMFLRRVGATTRWDQDLGLHEATYVREGREHTLWVEDARSLGLKSALVDEYGLAGIAAWRMGFAGPEAWQALGSAQVPSTTTPPPPPGQPPGTPEPAPVQGTDAPAPTPVADPLAPRRETDARGIGLALVAFAAAAGAVVLSVRARRRR